MLPFLRKSYQKDISTYEPAKEASDGQEPRGSTLEIDPHDPLVEYLLNHPEVIDVQDLPVVSPAVRILETEGVKTIVPLVAQGELIGLLNLGQRMSTQGYTLPDRSLLNQLSTHAATALRVAELAELQQVRARKLERMDHELQVAQIIQKTLLPKTTPTVGGWEIGSFWNPAQAIGGDFYDFINFPDGRLGIVIGDVTDKGVPAALVMAETRSILRTVAMRIISPGQVLARVNDQLGPDIPDRMFITCLYIVIDPVHGHIRMANAGHNLPILTNREDIREIMVRGMPLGIFPGMVYEEIELDIQPGDSLFMYSDGISEAHNPSGEIYGTPRLKKLLSSINLHNPIQFLIEDVRGYTGEGWEQEDDITIVTAAFVQAQIPTGKSLTLLEELYPGEPAHVLTEFSLPSLSGYDRTVMEKVAGVLEKYSIDVNTLQRIKTAVAETALNAIEHGNKYQPELPVTVQVLTTHKALSIRITDCGEGGPIPEPIHPDLTAKLDGAQSARGWGLFLIKSMSDEMRIFHAEAGNTVELVYRLV